jgi:hypothetical protein
MLWPIRLSLDGTDTSEARTGKIRSEINSTVYSPRTVNTSLLYAVPSDAIMQRISVDLLAGCDRRSFPSPQSRVRPATGHFHFALSTAACFRFTKHQDLLLRLAFAASWLTGAPLSFSCFTYRHNPMEHLSFTITTETSSWLRHCATSWKVAGSIPDGIIKIFHWHNPPGRSMSLGLT